MWSNFVTWSNDKLLRITNVEQFVIDSHEKILLHMKFFAPQTMSAASATIIMYVWSLQGGVFPNFFDSFDISPQDGTQCPKKQGVVKLGWCPKFVNCLICQLFKIPQ